MNQVKFNFFVYSLMFLISLFNIVMDWETMVGLNFHVLVRILSGVIAFSILFFWGLKKNKQMVVLLNNTEK